MNWRQHALALMIGGALMGFVAVPGAAEEFGGNVAAEGAFTCDFGLSPDLPLDRVGPTIERDRMYQAARPGFQRKLIPLSIDFTTGGLQSGGRYLFTSHDEARDYQVWVENAFVLDGVKFFDRLDSSGRTATPGASSPRTTSAISTPPR
jgi:hypothetical protein